MNSTHPCKQRQSHDSISLGIRNPCSDPYSRVGQELAGDKGYRPAQQREFLASD
jgi:hypothetical protein